MALNLSEFKIRYPDFPKYVWESQHPYSDVMNIKKDRRNPEHTKRPLNAFMLFAKIQREHITTHFNCNHSEISKALGRLWQDLSREEKEPFTQGAKTLVALHRLEYPDYKYRPRKKGAPKEAAGATPAAAAATSSPVKRTAQRRPTGRGARAAPARRTESTAEWAAEPTCERASEQTVETCRPTCGSLGNLGSPAPPESPLSFCLASPSRFHTPCSPVSIGSSSGYESELPPELPSDLPSDIHSEMDMQTDITADFAPEFTDIKTEFDAELAYKFPARSDEYELRPAQDDPLHGFGTGAEPEIGADLRDIEVTALGETALLNPLAMFPALGLTCDDLDEMRLNL